MYPTDLTAPMAVELNKAGIESLHTATDVETKLANDSGTILMVVNSVCGCAAANARPGVIHSLQNEKTPTEKYTVFAGVDKEATDVARNHMMPYPPSSPSIGLFKDGRLVHMLERRHIEGATAQMISDNLKLAFDKYC